MDNNERNVFLFCIFMIFSLLGGVTSCVHYQENVLPIKMAEKGFCLGLTSSVGPINYSYQPCQSNNNKE